MFHLLSLTHSLTPFIDSLAVKFGLAVLQCAQLLRRHVSIIRSNLKASRQKHTKLHEKGQYKHAGTDQTLVFQGLEVSDSLSSRPPHTYNKRGHRHMRLLSSTLPTPSPSYTPEHHWFNWRDYFDVLVRWRQVSEPKDVVWWIDGLPEGRDSGDRVGLNTYMVSGLGKIVRYYPYYGWGFNLTKDLIVSSGYFNGKEQNVLLSNAQKKRVMEARDLDSLVSSVGSESIGFFVNAPIESILHRTQIDQQHNSHSSGDWRQTVSVLNGTRLTVAIDDKGGVGFSICSPSTPERFKQYEIEMASAFERLICAFVPQIRNVSMGFSANMDDDFDRAAVVRHALEIFYYWVNFAPLSRGTSATGYAAFLASILAMGEDILDRVPEMTQLDWEAMFTKRPEDFVAKVERWVKKRAPTVIPREWLDTELKAEDVSSGEIDKGIDRIFRTFRHMFYGLGAERDL